MHYHAAETAYMESAATKCSECARENVWAALIVRPESKHRAEERGSSTKNKRKTSPMRPSQIANVLSDPIPQISGLAAVAMKLKDILQSLFRYA